MKISYNWLKEHLPLEMSAKDLAEHLLRLGFEVAAIQSTGPKFTGVVVAKVLAKDKHPNADKLAVCVVDDGAQKWNVVCGAPNVAAGQTIAFARIGAVLPGNFKIAKAKLRGVESQGMICSREELGLPKDGDGIWVMGEGPSLGTEVGSLLGPADDILEVEVTSNRPDCLSHRGLARELAAYFKKPLAPVKHSVLAENGSKSVIAVEDAAACPYYSARLITGVKNSVSPAWLKTKLEAIGLRPINAIADITNFILHDCGQPLHAFDADKLAGGKIVVRRSKAGEKFRALDHKDYSLPEGLLVIADENNPVALAGVMGGEATAVTETTTRVLLEAAYFSPSEARRSSQTTRLRSDSSYRYERGVDPVLAREASARAAALIAEFCGGQAGPAAEAAAPRPAAAPISSTVARINGVLGSAFPAEAVHDALRSIAADYKANGDAFTFVPPTWRYDLKTANDLAEEVGRFLGYDNIPYRMAPLTPRAARLTPVEAESRRVRTRLAALGLFEAYNYDLLSEKTLAACRLSAADQPRVADPLSEDWAVLRPSLLPGLLKNAAHNLNRGADYARFFELGKVYATRGQEVDERWRAAGLLLGPALDARWQTARAPRLGFYDAKACVEELFSRAGALTWKAPEPAHPMLHPVNALAAFVGDRAVAVVGQLHPKVARAFDLEKEGVVVFDADLEWLAGRESSKVKYAPFSSFPVSRRDLALLVPKSVSYSKVESVISAVQLPELQDVLLFDVYEGKGVPEGQVSLAVRLTFGRDDRTLTDAEVAKAVETIVAALGKELGAKLRG